jgi:hypothetical protein
LNSRWMMNQLEEKSHTYNSEVDTSNAMDRVRRAQFSNWFSLTYSDVEHDFFIYKGSMCYKDSIFIKFELDEIEQAVDSDSSS